VTAAAASALASAEPSCAASDAATNAHVLVLPHMCLYCPTRAYTAPHMLVLPHTCSYRFTPIAPTGTLTWLPGAAPCPPPQVHPRSKACVIIPCATYGLGQAGRTSFWDKAVGWYLAGQWQDFPTNWIHIEDLARWGQQMARCGVQCICLLGTEAHSIMLHSCTCCTVYGCAASSQKELAWPQQAAPPATSCCTELHAPLTAPPAATCSCRVFVALVQKGRPGGRYLAAGEPMLVSHFFEMYCRLAGREVPAGGGQGICARGAGLGHWAACMPKGRAGQQASCAHHMHTCMD
jgi:hypothetical protein